MNWIQKTIRPFPLLGGLANTTIQNHLDAWQELFWTIFVSTMPIWAGMLISLFTEAGQESFTYQKALAAGWSASVSRGELFLYAAAGLGPIFYIALRQRSSRQPFPSTTSHIILVLIIVVCSSIVFTMDRLMLLSSSAPLMEVSVGAYVTSLILLYLAVVYNNSLDSDPMESQKEQEKDYFAKMSERRK